MTASIVSCGPTAKEWFNTPCDISIGCNDVAKFGKDTDRLVLINRKFSPEREKIIMNSRPEKVYTHLDHWKRHFKQAELIRMQPFGKHVRKGHIYSSKSSSFVALSIAFNLHADKVIMFGCDLNDHHVIKGKLRDYELRNFERFTRELNNQGCQVYVSSLESSLSKFLPVYIPTLEDKLNDLSRDWDKFKSALGVNGFIQSDDNDK